MTVLIQKLKINYFQRTTETGPLAHKECLALKSAKTLGTLATAVSYSPSRDVAMRFQFTSPKF